MELNTTYHIDRCEEGFGHHQEKKDLVQPQQLSQRMHRQSQAR